MKYLLKIIPCLFIMIFTVLNTSCSDEMMEREQEAERMMKTHGVQRNYVFSLHANSLILIDSFFLKPGGTLYDIVKNGSEWQLLETIDLNSILGEFSPKNVVFNDHWICINAVPKSTDDLDKLFFFQKQKDGWKYVEFPETMTRENWGESFAFCQKDFFLCGQGYDPNPTGTGKIFFYDLTHNPPKLLQTILPERNTPRGSFGGFGYSFTVHDDLLIVKDGSAGYTKEEFQYYGLTKDDLNPTKVSGIEQPVRKYSFPVYRLENDTWKYQVDLYDRLPHPQGSVVRCTYACNSWAGNRHYPMPRFENDIYFSKNKIYLAGSHDFFSFHVNKEWDFDLRIEAKFLWVNTPYPPKYFPNYDLTTRICIAEKYSLGMRSDGNFEIYQTANLPKWEPLWTQSFGNEKSIVEAKKIRDDNSSGVTRSGKITGNTLLLHCNYHDAYKPGNSMSKIPAWSGFYLYEINETTGPSEVFRLEAQDNKNLEVVKVVTLQPKI